MTNISGALIFAVLLLALSFPVEVHCSPYVISDNRIRSLDITPVLGRGYSIMTNSFQSNCLMVEETTVPSYNYDYSFYDFTETTNLQVEASKKMSYSLGYFYLQKQISKTTIEETRTETRTRYITASMRIERYYASVREEVSPLAPDAVAILERKDYVGFFKACGPTYIRGIRRAQEVTAYFIFKSASTENASSYSSSVRTSNWRRGTTNYKKNIHKNQKSESKSMRIVIKGFGMGLTQEGSNTLVARTLEDYNGVMDFAFHSMTRGKDSHHIGMVYGMEVVSWVENTAWQIATDLQSESMELPLPLNLIPRAFEITNPLNLEFDNTDNESRARFTCKEPSLSKDKFGYCCEESMLYDLRENEYNSDNPGNRVCKPLRQLDPTLAKENISQNGEFVARLDRAVRYKMNSISTLQRCVSAANAIPDRYQYNILKKQDTVKYDGVFDMIFTPFELKMALDPFNDYAMVKHMAEELDEYLEMFIAPCIAAIFGINNSVSLSNDAAFIMAYPWHSYDECRRLSCLGSNVRWDRSSEEGGCVSNILTGRDSASFSGDTNCKLEVRSDGTLECKHKSVDLNDTHSKTVKAWTTILPSGSTSWFMDMYCMPIITSDVIDAAAITEMKTKYQIAFGGEGSINVALKKVTSQSDSYYHEGESYKASRAVDGDIDGNAFRGSVSITTKTNNSWWYVDLGGTHTIQKIIVYNRTDCCQERLQNFVVRIENSETGNEVWSYTFPGEVEKVNIIEVPDEEGDRVRISLEGTKEFLQLAEVEVWNKFLIED